MTTDVKIIPLRTGVGSAYNDAGSNGEFNRIRIEWYSEEDNRTVRDLANYTSVYSSMTDSRTFTTSKTAMGGTEGKWRNFGQSATIAPPIRVGIIQTDETFRYYDEHKNVCQYTCFTGDIDCRSRESRLIRFFDNSIHKQEKISNLLINVFYAAPCLKKMLELGRKGITIYYVPSPNKYTF